MDILPFVKVLPGFRVLFLERETKTYFVAFRTFWRFFYGNGFPVVPMVPACRLDAAPVLAVGVLWYHQSAYDPRRVGASVGSLVFSVLP